METSTAALVRAGGGGKDSRSEARQLARENAEEMVAKMIAVAGGFGGRQAPAILAACRSVLEVAMSDPGDDEDEPSLEGVREKLKLVQGEDAEAVATRRRAAELERRRLAR